MANTAARIASILSQPSQVLGQKRDTGVGTFRAAERSAVLSDPILRSGYSLTVRPRGGYDYADLYNIAARSAGWPGWRPGAVYETLMYSGGAFDPNRLLGVRALARKYGVEKYLRWDPDTGRVFLGGYEVPYVLNLGGRTYARAADLLPIIKRVAGTQ